MKLLLTYLVPQVAEQELAPSLQLAVAVVSRSQFTGICMLSCLPPLSLITDKGCQGIIGHGPSAFLDKLLEKNWRKGNKW
jgi:hypothetical protein